MTANSAAAPAAIAARGFQDSVGKEGMASKQSMVNHNNKHMLFSQRKNLLCSCPSCCGAGASARLTILHAAETTPNLSALIDTASNRGSYML